MNITYIMPGTGGTFYCQNCERDYFLVKALERQGHTVTIVPLYLPYMQAGRVLWDHVPVFYGAVNVYLDNHVPLYRYLPRFIKRLMDWRVLLRLIARKSGTLSAYGLEEMTLAMMDSASVCASGECRRMTSWLDRQPPPDVIHIANTLLCGFIRPLKEHFNCPVVCSVQDEHTWIMSMRDSYIDRVWQTMERECAGADALLSVSRFYSEYINDRISLPQGILRTVHLGVPVPAGNGTRSLPEAPVIGFMSRLCESLGLGILADAFILLAGREGFKNIRLRLTGGNSGEDAAFIDAVMEKLSAAGLADRVERIPTPTHADRTAFLRSLTVLCVPVLEPMAFSLFMLEALAVNVPVVVSSRGALPELAETVGGTVCFDPDTPDACAAALEKLLRDPQQVRSLGRQGYEQVCRLNTDTVMAAEVVKIYGELTSPPAPLQRGEKL